MYKLLPILLFAYGLAVTTDEIYDNSYALIIGIDKYQNVQHLNYAVKDAESIQVTCPPKVVPSVKLVVVQTERNTKNDT